MPDKILVTGFERFGPLKRSNKSGEVVLPAVKERYGDTVETVLLPVAYDVAAQQLIEHIQHLSPAAIAMFGISSRRGISLETQAKNRRFSMTIPDNNGVRATGRIDKQGPSRYASTLPLDDIYTRLSGTAVPTRLSADAGTFICNEVMYKALDHIEATGKTIPTGFIHIGNGLQDQLITEAAFVVVEELIKATSSQQ